MKPELLFLILLLFGFILHCFLGNKKGFYKRIEGMTDVETQDSSPSTTSPSTTSSLNSSSDNSYENYNHYNGTSIATKYYGPNGEVAIINSPSSITVTNSTGISVEYTSSASSSTQIESITYLGPNGEKATFVSGSNGGKALKVTDAQGNSVTYGVTPTSSSGSSFMNNNPLTSYFGSTGNPVPNNSAYAYVSPGPDVSSYNQYQYQPQTNPPYNYSSSLPPGIPRSQILPGQEDLYILKSQVVPPVCPACNPVVIYKDKECQACPPCGRCPEPSFECKKVPNYNAINNEYLPTPILNSFAGFGM